ncbi:MAG TPA: hypothetical protein VHX40_04965, partial [Acidimicrobiales bacterium]|nr:hypothetical protein [Acidimicrobiales bacterium]
QDDEGCTAHVSEHRHWWLLPRRRSPAPVQGVLRQARSSSSPTRDDRAQGYPDAGVNERFGLRNYKAALKTITAKVTAVIERDIELTPDRARELQAEFGALTEARRMYDDTIEAARFPGSTR